MDPLSQLQASPPSQAETDGALTQAGIDQDTFLKIFMAQLQHQDPQNPEDTSQLSSQLAQFSQLEQTIRSKDELQGINSRLDRLIEATGGQSGFQLDPVSLIGHDVETGFRVPASGSPSPLRIDLPEQSDSMSIRLNDVEGNLLAIADIEGVDAQGNLIPLPTGAYQLSIDNGQPRLTVPDGGSTDLVFRVSNPTTGGIDPGAPAFAFDPDTTYAFSVVADSPSRGRYEPATNLTGTVEAVRLLNGQPILSVSGREIDPAQILRIR